MERRWVCFVLGSVIVGLLGNERKNEDDRFSCYPLPPRLTGGRLINSSSPVLGLK